MSTNSSGTTTRTTPSTPSDYTVSHHSGSSIRSSNAAPYIINALKKSIFLLQQGAQYRPGSSPHFSQSFTKTNLRAYRFVRSKWYRVMGFIICMIQLSLCFMEPNTLFLKSIKYNPIISLHWCLLIEAYCILMHIFALYLNYKACGGHLRNCLYPYCWTSALSLLSLLITLIKPWSIFRLYRFLRVGFPLLYWTTARVWKVIIVHTFKRTFIVIFLGSLLITTTFSTLVFAFYNKQSILLSPVLRAGVDEITEFYSLARTMIQVFLYATANNTPQLWEPIYKYDKWQCIFWLLLLLIMYQLLKNVLLSITYDEYSDIEQAIVSDNIRLLKQKIRESFHTIASMNALHRQSHVHIVTKKQMKYVYNTFNYMSVDGLYKPEHFEIFWLYCNDKVDKDYIEQEQFTQFCLLWMSTFHLRERYIKPKDDNFIRRVFAYKVFKKLSIPKIIFGLLSIVQCILIIIRLEQRDHETKWIVVFIKLSNFVWLAEMFLRIYVYGIRDYIWSSNVINGAITIFIIFAAVTHIHNGVFFHHMRRHDFWHILRVAYIVLFVADLSNRLHAIFYCSLHAIRQVTVFIFVVILFQIFLALIGMELFANIPDWVNPAHVKEQWELADGDKLFEFGTFTGAFNLVNVVFNENGFGQWMLHDAEETTFLYDSQAWHKEHAYWMVIMYWICSYILQVWFLCNLLTSIFLENYSHHVQEWVDSSKMSELKDSIINKLQACADIVEDGKYEPWYWCPQIQSTKSIAFDQFIIIR